MSQTDTFKLVSFTPIGFKKRVYPNTLCYLCRGILTNCCPMCDNKDCNIVKYNDTYCHQHCQALKISAETKKQ